MTDKTIFLSDLHLCAETPAQCAAFVRLFSNAGDELYDAVYVLGDVFNAWLGDDLEPEFVIPIKSALRTLTQSGTRVFLMPGNRDFLLGKQFCLETGCQLLADPTIVDLYGRPTLLAHGDAYCSLDRTHQLFRWLTHSQGFAQFSRWVPSRLRYGIADQLRAASQHHTARLADHILDVYEPAIIVAMQAAGVQHIIHGHTHRPAIHTHQDGRWIGIRHVLPSWDNEPQVCVYDSSGQFETVSNF